MEVFNFTGTSDFLEKLEAGNRLEKIVCDHLIYLGYDARLTPQDPASKDPELGDVDVIIYEFGRPKFGVECKLISQKFRISPYGDFNVPLNARSVDKYSSVDFPVFIFAGNLLTRKIYITDMKGLYSSSFTIMSVNYKRDRIINYDASHWYITSNMNEAIERICNWQ